MSRRNALAELRRMLLLLEQQPLKAVLAPDVTDYLGRRWRDPRADGAAGYSDGELGRIVAAARSDAVAISARIEAGQRLVTRYRQEPGALSPQEEPRARALAEMAETGLVPCPGEAEPQVLRWRLETAGQLFLTPRDVAPLLVLGVALTGRNVDTLKELPAEHRLLDGKAVEVTVVKRRRGRAAGMTRRPGRSGRPAGACSVHRKSAVRLLWFYRRQISDGLGFDPSRLDDWAEPHAGGRGENRTGRIPEPVMGPLLA